MPTQIKKVTISKLNTWQPTEGEICEVVTENGKHYKYKIFHDNEWKDIQMDSSGISMGLYDMNKQIISQIPDLENIDNKINLINDYYNNTNNKYYMLYGKEISYFTLFKINDVQYFGKEVIECLNNIGSIKAIDMTQDNDAIEIWVKYNEDECTCLYLFQYDTGLIEVGE